MIYWAQLFHFYQPPTQFPAVLRKVCEESYRPLVEIFQEHPGIKATFNINGVLLEMLADYGHSHIIKSLRDLLGRGQVEITGSGKYHPILPLIPLKECTRQIRLNSASSKFFLGKGHNASGFFPPEMAYGSNIAKEVLESGHRWMILSGIACPTDWPIDVVHYIQLEDQKLAVFFRDDILSNKISFKTIGPKEFLAHLEEQASRRSDGAGDDMYVVTAMDAETYGHHIKDWERLFLGEVYAELQARQESYEDIMPRTALAAQQDILADVETAKLVTTAKITEVLDRFPPGQAIEPRASSWSTSAQDLEEGVPYPLWLDRSNEIHRLLWEHMELAAGMVQTAVAVADTDDSKRFSAIARGLLDRAYQSDQFWWASRRPMWDINLIHMGLIDQLRVLVNAFKAINTSNVGETVKREYYYRQVAARDIRNKISDRLFIM